MFSALSLSLSLSLWFLCFTELSYFRTVYSVSLAYASAHVFFYMVSKWEGWDSFVANRKACDKVKVKLLFSERIRQQYGQRNGKLATDLKAVQEQLRILVVQDAPVPAWSWLLELCQRS